MPVPILCESLFNLALSQLLVRQDKVIHDSRDSSGDLHHSSAIVLTAVSQNQAAVKQDWS